MPHRPVHFLLVDDLEENLLSLEGLLRREGLVLLRAKSGTQALELMLRHDIDLALLDVQMPEMDGFELAEYMRGAERTRHIPIIFLTAGAADSQRRFRGYETGAVDFLHKPIEADILRSKADVFFQLSKQKAMLAFQRDELARRAAENEKLLFESRQNAEALRDADRRKDEFLATLAHELRNPLAPVVSGINLLKRIQSDPKGAEVCAMMGRQVAHLVRLVDDLLDVSRITQGKIELRRQRVALADAVQAAVEAASPQIDAYGHRLAVNVMADIYVDGDMTRLSQMISNLLNNAAKYTPEKGEIAIEASVDDGMAMVEVRDNGLGLPPEAIGGIFDIFTQAHAGNPRTQSGLGIGLALVRRLAEMHGGSIAAQSEGAGKGSTFTLRLPLVAAEGAAAVEEEQASITPLRILVVDDNEAAAQTLGWMLEMDGHEVAIAHSGQEALAVSVQPEVVLLDIGLPGMSGYDVCREMNSDPRYKDAVFIAQTGWGQEKDRQAAFAAGFDYHLTKPVSMDDLNRLLSSGKPPKTAT